MIPSRRVSSNRQGAAAWLTGAASAPTVMDPLRGSGTGFGETAYSTAASPCPLISPVIEIQAGVPVTDHVQSRDVEMLKEPVPPLAPNDAWVFPTAS